MILIIESLGMDNAGGSYKIDVTDSHEMMIGATRTDASGENTQYLIFEFNETDNGCVVYGSSIFLKGVEEENYDDHFRNYCNLWTPWTYSDTFRNLEVIDFCQTVPAQPEVSCYKKDF